MFATLYAIFAKRTRYLLFGYACFVIFSAACLGFIQQSENIDSLLPDSETTQVRRDFNWLQKAPFARKVLIDLHAQPGITDDAFKQVAGQFATAISPLFNAVLSAPPLNMQHNLPDLMLQALPNLVSDDDLTQIEQRFTSANIDHQLLQMREQLFTPQSWLVKQQLQHDPLALWQIAAAHLRHLNPMNNADEHQRDFVSRDGRHRLLVADTAVAIGDVAGGGILMDKLQQMIDEYLPATISATVVSGHKYTMANARTIQRDLRVVLGVSTLAILLIFILLLRSWRAIFVFLLPASVLGAAAAMVAVFFPTVSGITIGFGAVLLGITVDFTLHVYFALRHAGDKGQQLRRLTPPLLGGALTSFLAFSVLLLSALPGQRQLAVFSMAAIAMATMLALVVMPHLCGTSKSAGKKTSDNLSRALFPSRQRRTRTVIIIWLLVMSVCAWATPQLHFDGDMRSLSVVPPQLQQAEQQIRQLWGNMRSSALLFAPGKTIDEALQVNDAIYKIIAESCSDRTVTAPDGESGNVGDAPHIVSLASILPSQQQQQKNRQRWQRFWQQHGAIYLSRLYQAGAKQGFSPQAFQNFTTQLAAPIKPLTVDFWRKAGFGAIIDSLTVVDMGGAFCRKNPHTALVALIDEVDLTVELQQQLNSIPGAIVVAQGVFRQQLSGALASDFIQFILLALAVVVGVLILWYRRLVPIILALLPVFSGTLFMFGAMGWLGISFNLFNVIAAILIIGLGVDYGIFMLSRCDGSGCQQAERSVLVSALTTLAGFGSLVLARHPAMYSIGITVLFGISAAVLTALYVLPIFYQWWYSVDGDCGDEK